MLEQGPSFHEIFPNEVIHMILGHLSWRQRLGVHDVNLLWRFLGRSFLNNFFQQEYPYLTIDALNDTECVVLLEKQ